MARMAAAHSFGAAGRTPADSPQKVLRRPVSGTRPCYSDRDGQAEIKRNEALARVWRHLLALANRTLTDWADPEEKIGGDILSAIDDPKRPTAMSIFEREAYERKADLLFGNRADLFKRPGDESFEKAVLKLALDGAAALRHASFHFKSLGAFAEALAKDPKSLTDPAVAEAIQRLADGDFAGRAERLRQTMRADHFEYFFKEHQNACDRVWEAGATLELYLDMHDAALRQGAAAGR
jgi:hypothetical protein